MSLTGDGYFLFIQVLNKAFFLPLIGTGEEIRSQYQQLAQVVRGRVIISNNYIIMYLSVIYIPILFCQIIEKKNGSEVYGNEMFNDCHFKELTYSVRGSFKELQVASIV